VQEALEVEEVEEAYYMSNIFPTLYQYQLPLY
jgi:hypothetical protein